MATQRLYRKNLRAYEVDAQSDTRGDHESHVQDLQAQSRREAYLVLQSVRRAYSPRLRTNDMLRIREEGRKMTQRLYRKNLRAWYAQSTDDERAEGLDWYPSARREVARIACDYRLPNRMVAHVIAALSPRNKWERNLADAEAFVAAFLENRPMPSANTFSSNRRSAWRVLHENAEATGRKVSSFAANLTGDDDTLTVDTWTIRAATGGRVDTVQNLTEYREVARAYVAVARELGLTPASLQAIIWIAIRNAN